MKNLKCIINVEIEKKENGNEFLYQLADCSCFVPEKGYYIDKSLIKKWGFEQMENSSVQSILTYLKNDQRLSLQYNNENQMITVSILNMIVFDNYSRGMDDLTPVVSLPKLTWCPAAYGSGNTTEDAIQELLLELLRQKIEKKLSPGPLKQAQKALKRGIQFIKNKQVPFKEEEREK